MPLAARLSCRASGVGIVDSSQSAADGTHGNLLLCRTCTSWVIYGCATPSWEPRCTSTLTHTLTGFFSASPKACRYLFVSGTSRIIVRACLIRVWFRFFPPDLPSKYLHLHSTQQPAILPVASSPLLDNPSHSLSKCSQEV